MTDNPVTRMGAPECRLTGGGYMIVRRPIAIQQGA